MGRKVRVLLSIGLISLAVGFASVPFMAVVGMIGVFGYSCTPIITVSSTPNSTTASASKAYFDQFSDEDQAKKKAIASMIISIGRERKLSDRSIAIAIGTAIQESNLTNLPFLGKNNDHQSLGIFQQQPSPTWGTAEQIQDPTHAINAFYDALVTIPDRDTRPMMDVAIEVQNPSIKAYESRWKWDEISAEIVAENGGSSSQQCAGQNSGGWQLPLDAKSYTITDGFGSRFDPVYLRTQLHDGVDLGAAQDTPIHAAHSGTVAEVDHGGPNSGGYGNYVELDNGNGVVTGYGHMHSIAEGLKKGDTVTTGQVIGYVGSTGASTGNHLHFLLHLSGKPSDPIAFMDSNGVSIKDGQR